MKCKLVVKDCNGLYTIYLTKLCKVLIRVISGVIIVFNFISIKSYSVLLNPLFISPLTPLNWLRKL
jgi:hypothetical protein